MTNEFRREGPVKVKFKEYDLINYKELIYCNLTVSVKQCIR